MHNTKFKKKTPRKTRSDEGKPKKSMTSLLCGIELPVQVKSALEQPSEGEPKNTSSILEAEDQKLTEEKSMLTTKDSLNNALNNDNTVNKCLVIFQNVFSYTDSFQPSVLK